MTFQPADRELVIRDEYANRVVGWSGGIVGRLIITNQRIVHRRMPLFRLFFDNVQVDLADIVAVSRCNIAGIVPNGVAISTRSGTTVKFQVFGPADIVEVITNLTTPTQCMENTDSES